MKLVLLILFMSSLNAVKAQCNTDVEVICYWGSWSIYREDIGYFNASHIDTDICTTLVYSFIGLDLDLDITSLDQNADITNGGFASFNQLKEKNPCLKTMLAIGGWNEGSRKYSVVASTEEGRKRFANSVLRFLAYYKFDGIDIDWEYPTTRGGLPDDGKNLALLLKEIKATISPWNLKLSIAVSIDDTLIGIGYPVADIAPSVDHVNIMAYDYISSNSPITGLSSPLSEIKKSIGKWLDNGLPPEKLVLGLPTYAKNFVLEDPAQGDIGAPVSEIGRPGIWTNEKGLLAYYEVLYTFEIIPKEDIHVYLSDDTYYAYYDDEWFTYDNEETFKTKVTYALDQKLKGIMIWALELDDFSGAFGPKYPLLNAIQNSINQFKKTNKYA